MGGGDGLFGALAVLDPISTGIGYGTSAAATAIDGGTGGWFTEINRAVAPGIGKAAIAYQEGGDAASVGTALGTGLATDASRFTSGLGGPVAWAAQGASDTAGVLGATSTIDSTTATYAQLGAGAVGSLWGLGSSALTGASSAASTAGEAASTASTASSALSDSAYKAAFYGTDAKVFGDAGTMTFQEAKDSGALATVGNTGTDAAKGGGMLDTVSKYGSTALKLGSAGMSLYSAYLGAQAANASAKAEADRLEGEAEIAEGKADLADLQQIAETNAAAEEKMQLAKRRRAIVGKGKTAAAANGVMLETRAESSPAMFEQDAAMELANEQAKIDYNLKLKNSTHAQNAALYRMSAATSRLGATNAKRLGNLNATTSWIQGGIGAATSLASAFYKD